jgi:hypothetical protein
MVELSSVSLCFRLHLHCIRILTRSLVGTAIYPRRGCHPPRLEAVKYIRHG